MINTDSIYVLTTVFTIVRITKNARKDKPMMNVVNSMNRMNQRQQLIVKVDNGLFVLRSEWVL